MGGGYIITNLADGTLVTDPAVVVSMSAPYFHEHPGRDGHNDSWDVQVHNGSQVPIEFDVKGTCLVK